MRIKTFRLVGYSDIFEQVIIGGSKIMINIKIFDYDGSEIILDISNYSNIGFISFKDSSFFKIIDVDFLGLNGLNCKKNDLNSRVNLKIGDDIYYSNPIGNYIYNDNFLLEDSSFFNIGDHHLGVYNQFNVNLKESVKDINEIHKYPNDIIFIDRSRKTLNNFIFLGLDFKDILKKYIYNLKKGEKSIFYIDIFSTIIDELILENIKQVLKIFKYRTYYFYNIDYKYLEEYKFDKKIYLYNHHFKPTI